MGDAIDVEKHTPSELQAAPAPHAFHHDDAKLVPLAEWQSQSESSAAPYYTKCVISEIEPRSYLACPSCRGRVEPTFQVGSQ